MPLSLPMSNSASTIILNFIKGKKGSVGQNVKYYKRELKAKGGYRYWYSKEEYEKDHPDKETSKELGLLEKIAGFFKTDPSDAKKVPKKEYETHSISEKGISYPEWTSHFAKYFERKAEYDARFNQEKTATSTNGKIIDKNQETVTKIAEQKSESKSIYKTSIFRTLFNLYGEKNVIESSTGRTLPENQREESITSDAIHSTVDLREPGGDLRSRKETDNNGQSSTLLGDAKRGSGHDVLDGERLKNFSSQVKFISTMLDEKGIDIDKDLNKPGHIGLTYRNLLEFIDSMPKETKAQIKKTFSQIDFRNGDINHYLDFLVNGMIQSMGLNSNVPLSSDDNEENEVINQNALSEAMIGNQNAKKDSPSFQLVQESVPESKGFQKENNLFGITPQTERKILNTNFQPKLQVSEVKTIPEFVTMVKDALLKEGLDQKAEEWVDQAYKSDAKSLNDLLNKAYRFVQISSEDSNKIRKGLKSIPHQSNLETAAQNVETIKEKFSQKKQFEINAKCKEILASTPPSQITEEQKEILRLYEGSGGQSTNDDAESNRGMLYQFFTPRKMISKVQDIMARYLKPGDSGLEPSAGIGRFAEGEGSKYNWDMLEYNPDDNTAYQIARILHPEANVSDKAFETLFVDSKNRSVGENYKGKKYNFISGNPPYGEMSGKFKAIEGKGWNRYEHYFINRGLDTLEEGGTMFYVVPSTFLQAGETAWKKKIFGKAELLEAYRMPEGSFSNTQIGVDVIVLRKNTTGTQDNANAFNGKYFEQNPEHVFGETLERTNRFGRPENYVKGKADAFYEMNLPAPKEMSQAQKDAISLGLMGNENAKGKRKIEIAEATKKINKTATKKEEIKNTIAEKKDPTKKIDTYTQEEFNTKFNKKFTDKDLELVRNTSPTGIIDEKIPFDSESMAVLPGGARTPLYLYKAGNIKQKLIELENSKDELVSKYGEEQFERQRKLLISKVPPKINIEDITLTPIEPFSKGMVFDNGDGSESTLIQKFKDWVLGQRVEFGYGRRTQVRYEGGIDPKLFNGYSVTREDIIDYVDGERVRRSQDFSSDLRKEERKTLGNKYFKEFMDTVLTPSEKAKVELEWNDRYNVNANIDGSEIPVLLEGMSKTYKGEIQDPRDLQMEFVARYMAKGVGCATHEVGLGKTWSGIMSTVSAMQAGRTKKPLIVVPTSVLEKWYTEAKERFPNVPFQMVGTPELNKLTADQGGKYTPPEGTVTIMSYNAFETFGFSDEVYSELTSDIKDKIIDPKSSEGKKGNSKARTEAKDQEKVEGKMSLALKGTSNQLKFDEAGFDHLTVDEAHNFNNIFTDQASGRFGNNQGTSEDPLNKGKEEDEKESVNEYAGITGGTPSSRGWKMWLASQYVQKRNNNRNVLLLSATPFTNNPLQVYSLLSMIAREKLQSLGINSVRDFLGAFVESQAENVVKGDGTIIRKNVVRSWKNAPAFQDLIAEFFEFKSGDKNGVKRPKLKLKAVTIPLSEEQIQIRDQLESMYDARDKDGSPLPGAPLVSIGVQQLMGVSPALVKKGEGAIWDTEEAKDINPNGSRDFVERSPKLKYICDSIAGFYKAHQDAKPGDPIPGQIFFLPKGVERIKEVKEYLVSVKGLPPEAVEFLDAKSKSDPAKDPELKNRGIKRFTEITNDFNNINGKCKIIIGTDVIKEGVDLNRNTAVAYNSCIDWNPTTEVQKRGRHHRPGNLLNNVMWVDVLMEDSIDSKLYQKQGEKISRINQVFEKDGSKAIDISEINPDEMKLDLIRDPIRKARLSLLEESQKINVKAREAQSQALMYAGLSNDFESLTEEITELEVDLVDNEKYLKDQIDELKASGMEKKDWENKWNYKWAKDKVSKTKKDILEAKRKLERVENQLKSKGVNEKTATKEAEKFQAIADKLFDQVKEYKDPETQKKLAKKFADEIAKRDKDKIKTPLDQMVQAQVAEVLEMVGIKQIQKSQSSNLSDSRIVTQAKITIFNFLKGKKYGATV